MADNTDIAARWEELGQMDRAALRVAWADAFSTIKSAQAMTWWRSRC